MATIRKHGGKFQAIVRRRHHSQALLDRGWGKAKVEVATSGGQSYIESLQAVAEVIKLRKDNAV